MHVFSSGRFCASPKPSPRGEGAKLCSPVEVERSRLPPVVPVSRRVPVPRHKPSPRGEGAKLCSPDAVEASRLPPVPSGACLTSSLVCFCITCQVLFLSAEKPASAPCAAPASRTNGRHGASVHRSAPDRARRPLSTGAAPARPTLGPQQTAPALSTAKQVFHRVFHIFAGFPQRLSFPLAFLERDSVRSSEPWVLPAA